MKCVWNDSAKCNLLTLLRVAARKYNEGYFKRDGVIQTKHCCVNDSPGKCTSTECMNAGSRIICSPKTIDSGNAIKMNENCTVWPWEFNDWPWLLIYDTQIPDLGDGVKTLKDIPKGKRVMFYVGEITLMKDLQELPSKYGMKISNCGEGHLVINSKKYGGIARYCNHSGKKVANLKIERYEWETWPLYVLSASRKIKAGEQLTYFYNNCHIMKEKRFRKHKIEARIKLSRKCKSKAISNQNHFEDQTCQSVTERKQPHSNQIAEHAHDPILNACDETTNGNQELQLVPFVESRTGSSNPIVSSRNTIRAQLPKLMPAPSQTDLENIRQLEKIPPPPKLQAIPQGNCVTPPKLCTKQFKCPECDKSYSRKDAMLRHLKSIHEDPVVYLCKVCSVNYNLKSNLKQHMKRKHNSVTSDEKQRPFKCDECSKQFTMKKNLYQHCRKFHKEIHLEN
ncbi:putative zinc finger protein [Orchesella cincta]|uniref:Putative zinc finger protein n=1 Tax=Orchesella cincta TaxID=48709 RepID=A0A1D2M2H2_ORCCI|nr:putative zinc finger protein [Orchesella cincta]